jgi:hypothetical protein
MREMRSYMVTRGQGEAFTVRWVQGSKVVEKGYGARVLV